MELKLTEYLFLSACFCWDSRLSLRETDQNLNLVEPLVIETRTWPLHFATPKYSDYMQTGKGLGYCYMIGRGRNCCLLGQVTGLLLCLYVKNLSTLHFQFKRVLNQYVFVCIRFRANWKKNIIEELGHFFDGSERGFSFCPPKTFKPYKQTTWNTSHLHRIAWSSGKLEYEKLFAVFYDIKLMNEEVFAKGLEKCRLLTKLLGQKFETLDDYARPKIQDLVGEGKAESSWICSSYPFRHKTRLHCAERKAKVYGDWAMQHFNL